MTHFVPPPLWVNLISMVATVVVVYLLAVHARREYEGKEEKVIHLGEKTRPPQESPKMSQGDKYRNPDRKAA